MWRVAVAPAAMSAIATTSSGTQNVSATGQLLADNHLYEVDMTSVTSDEYVLKGEATKKELIQLLNGNGLNDEDKKEIDEDNGFALLMEKDILIVKYENDITQEIKEFEIKKPLGKWKNICKWLKELINVDKSNQKDS